MTRNGIHRGTQERVHEEGRVHKGHGWLTGLMGLVELDRDISLSMTTFFPHSLPSLLFQRANIPVWI